MINYLKKIIRRNDRQSEKIIKEMMDNLKKL